MNAYYQNTNFGRTLPQEHTENTRKTGDGLINLICSLVTLLTCPVAMVMVKAVVCTATVIAFFGVIGGIECGTISLLLGIVICTILSAVEFFLLRSMVRKNKKNAAE